jgi:plasmid stabilization system protein ParE
MAELRMTPRALDELVTALNWYADRSAEAESNFALAIDNALDALQSDPGRFPKLNDRYRYVRISRFPYYIAFQIIGDHVALASFRHTSQSDPEFEARR